MSTSRSAEFIAGLRAEAPILLGVTPFGLIYGALAVAAHLPDAASQAMSSIVFAGSAQFVATRLFVVNAPVAVLLLTTFVVNLRHLLYSASIAPYLQHLPRRWRWLLAYLLTDEAYAVAIIHYRNTPAAAAGRDMRHWFTLGAGLALWTTWQLSSAAGIFLGSQIPVSWSLDFALPLTFLALLVPAVTDRPALAAALTAGAVGLMGAGWPYKIGLVAAALMGILVGAALDARQQHRSPEPSP